MKGRILAVDPGEKRIGIAISDPTGTIARTLSVIKHISIVIDCAAITQLAVENEAVQIIVGKALGGDGEEIPQSRHSKRIAQTLSEQSSLPVALWDESGSTEAARAARVSMGVKRKKKSGHLDDLAAVVILQSFLDWQSEQVMEDV